MEFMVKRKRALTVAVAGAAFAGLLAANQALAQDPEPFPKIIVSGEGVETVAPDMAVLTLSVVREAETARAALDANTEAMAAVLQSMKDEGIDDRDLRTSNFSIEPRIIYPKSRSNGGTNEPPRIVGYTVRNSLTVRIRDLGRVGAILDTSVSLGVNQGGHISFTNEDPSAALAQARVKAMEAAIAKARLLAETAGVDLGKVIEISESARRPGPVAFARADMAAMEAAPVPVAQGENAYTVTVSVTFGIDQ